MDRYPEMCRRPGIEIISLSFQGLAQRMVIRSAGIAECKMWSVG